MTFTAESSRSTPAEAAFHNNTVPKLLNSPAEIRILIYEYIFDTDFRIVDETYGDQIAEHFCNNEKDEPDRPDISLLTVCRQMNSECTKLCFGRISLWYINYAIDIDREMMRSFLATHSAVLPHAKYLELLVVHPIKGRGLKSVLVAYDSRAKSFTILAEPDTADVGEEVMDHVLEKLKLEDVEYRYRFKG